MKALHKISFMLLVIGGLNWLLIGIGVGDIVARLGETGAQVIYVLVGIAAIYEMATHRKQCRTCSVKKDMSSPQPTV